MAQRKTARPDSIKVSVIGNRLDAISKEIGQTMLRTSRSPIFSEARDFVTAIFDADCRLVAQTAYIPVLMGALPYALRSIASAFAGDIEDGDVFILNDPYRGNNHPPDITIAKPVFDQDRVAFWSVSKGHHADVGGGGVAGYNPAAKVVWEEGIRDARELCVLASDQAHYSVRRSAQVIGLGVCHSTRPSPPRVEIRVK